MYRIRNGQNVYQTVKKRIFRSQRIVLISLDIGHEVDTSYCVRDCSHFLKFPLICMTM